MLITTDRAIAFDFTQPNIPRAFFYPLQFALLCHVVTLFCAIKTHRSGLVGFNLLAVYYLGFIARPAR